MTGTKLGLLVVGKLDGFAVVGSNDDGSNEGSYEGSDDGSDDVGIRVGIEVGEVGDRVGFLVGFLDGTAASENTIVNRRIMG